MTESANYLRRAAVFAGVLACSGVATLAQGQETVRLAVGDPIGSAVGMSAEHFAEQVAEATDGQVEVEVFADGVLFGGDQNAAVNMVQNGSLDAVILSTSVYASFEPCMNAISLPYLFSDYDQFVDYLEGEPGQQLLASMDRLNTEGLALMIRTFRHVTNSVRPIESPEDLEGLTLRVPNNKLWVEFFGPLGADPTPMDFTEVYTALQLGTIDGQENPVEVPLANKFYEVQDYLSLTGHIADGYILAFNQDLWEEFDDETQSALRQAAQDTARFKLEHDLGEEERMVAELEDRGMEVNELTPEAREAFQERALELYPRFESLVGEQCMADTLDYLGRN
ncbi:DctP family TRAP transporter solute-binding subunit [Sediminicurvatus halobius]|uniref:C4-dicarboxylate ABC transporter substrate-binding protein n=1 Tax=Sediminicurvatus halobius TaxID=2182432 RepID=A0A2U2MXD8_9GAMM|nr:DctP family TRAP transporter solute-binding subunit [Spiribacter halobius]PWG61530.1 C4-dicarboxylate ABC transporter substrate-binding protein [Spiribacter halobius]UEX78009.1 DctP family TRAP transporter solute-binding subunit [Spiribacter halobius]